MESRQSLKEAVADTDHTLIEGEERALSISQFTKTTAQHAVKKSLRDCLVQVKQHLGCVEMEENSFVWCSV